MKPKLGEGRKKQKFNAGLWSEDDCVLRSSKDLIKVIEPEKCVLNADGKTANCECFEIPYGKYFVDINAILNLDVYNDTIAECGLDGSGCEATNSAPVCESINNGTFSPGTDMISTFSFECVPEEGIGSTNCDQPPLLYAGCMTAPCSRVPPSSALSPAEAAATSNTASSP